MIQRVGTALNLNIHLHMLLLDAVYVNGAKGASGRFHRANEPASAELTQLEHTVASRVGRYLERQGWLERDAENDYLALDTADDDPLSVAGTFDQLSRCAGAASRAQGFDVANAAAARQR